MNPYVSIVVILALASLIVGVMVSLNQVFGPRGTNEVKRDAFECGNPPSGEAMGRFTVRFYLVALLFILFDVEVMFLFPWALLFRELGVFGIVQMFVFLTIVGVGLLYAWKKQALEWN